MGSIIYYGVMMKTGAKLRESVIPAAGTSERIMVFAPNSFSFWGGLSYTLYYVFGIVFSAISISIIRRS